MIDSSDAIPLEARSFRADDPSTIYLYRHLRDTAFSAPRRRKPELSLQAEWDLVLHCARIYRRMGCDGLALTLGITSV